MDHDVVERDPGMCVCKGGPTLEILKEIQRLYEERMEQINKASGTTKLQQQVDLLRSWVSDLVGQNTLLARAVEELETAATSKLLLERRKNGEVVSELRAECAALRRRLARKDSDLRGLVEVLRRLREFDYCTLDGIHFFEVTESDIFGSVEWRQKKLEQGDSVKTRNSVKHDSNRYKTSRHFRRNSKDMICAKVSELKLLNETLNKENMAKEREIRQLNKDAQCYEQTIMNLRKEMSNCKYHTPEVSMKDAEVMAGMCCTGNECGEWEPVKDFSEMLRDETLKYQERVQKMEDNLKASGDSIRALRKVNVTLTQEMHSMRRVCAALDEQCRAANIRAQFKDDIVKEMRRQLKQAKAKLKDTSSEMTSLKSKDFVSGDAECGHGASVSYDSNPFAVSYFVATTSTPNASITPHIACDTSMPNISVIERSTSIPALVSDASIDDLQSHFNGCSPTKNETFQINTLHFTSPPNESPITCSPIESPKNSPDNRSLNNYLPRDSIRTCLAKESPRSCLPKESPRICLPKESPRICASKKSPRFCLPRDSPRFCLPEESPTICISKESPRNCLPKESPGISCLNDSPEDSPKTCPRLERTGSKSSLNNFLPTESPRTRIHKYSPRSCHPWKRCKLCSKAKKTSFKCGCAQSCGLVSSGEAKDTCECVEELCFNDEASVGGSSPRGQSCRERDSDHVKLQPESSIEVLKKLIKEKVRRSCDRPLQKDSGATSSLAESTSATCDASATYYHNKLLATLQILQNKEETISVQADSLAVAEERIATLNERANDLKKELDRKTKEHSALRKTVECCKPQTVDVCLVTDRPREDQTDIVNTLENNLTVIEDLYRECFYETAKQENLIEMLRSSYLDVRVMDKQKADQIGRLQTVIDTQQWSLDRCQDIALEVDGLKMEISNFLNSSSSTNNDSGMWERSEESYAPAPGVQDDLQDVREQLLRLQDILAYDSCTCGFNDENMKWKKIAESLEIKVGELRDKLCEVECKLAGKWDSDEKLQADIESKQQELARIREQLLRTQNSSREQSSTVDAISIQLGKTKALLCEKTAEVTELRQENESQANKITDLQEELTKADHIIKENCKMRSEVAYLTTQVSLWRTQLEESKRRVHTLETELARTRAHAEHIDECYREKASKVAELQAHLEAAHARGTALCGEARRAVCGVRVWMRRMRDKHREKEALLKEKDSLIAVLRRRLEEGQNDSQFTSTSENTASCSKCLSSRDARSFCSASGVRQGQCAAPSTREMPSCSSTPASTPMRLVRKKQTGNYVWMCDEALQEPARRDAGNDAGHITYSCRHRSQRDVRHVRLTLDRAPRDVSPTEDLLLRVEQMSEALADSNRRWTRPRDAR